MHKLGLYFNRSGISKFSENTLELYKQELVFECDKFLLSKMSWWQSFYLRTQKVFKNFQQPLITQANTYFGYCDLITDYQYISLAETENNFSFCPSVLVLKISSHFKICKKAYNYYVIFHISQFYHFKDDKLVWIFYCILINYNKLINTKSKFI